MTNKYRDNWREKWLSCINELTSLTLQKSSWLDKTHSNPHWSFNEFMCSYFDDLAIDDNYNSQLDNGWISQQEFELIKRWHEELANYNSPKNDGSDHETILNDIKWLEIMEIGVNTRNSLAKLLSERERKFLIEEIDYLKYV